MKVDEFVNGYKEDKSILREHVKNDYVPLEMKQTIAQNVADSCYYTDGQFRQNSVAKYMLTRLALLRLYTDIEVTQGDSLGDFNKLNGIGVFDSLVGLISDTELKEFYDILDMISEDIKVNEYEMHGFVRGQVERFGNLVGTSLEPLINSVLENVKIEEFEEIIKSIVKNEEEK